MWKPYDPQGILMDIFPAQDSDKVLHCLTLASSQSSSAEVICTCFYDVKKLGTNLTKKIRGLVSKTMWPCIDGGVETNIWHFFFFLAFWHFCFVTFLYSLSCNLLKLFIGSERQLWIRRKTRKKGKYIICLCFSAICCFVARKEK